MPSKAKRGAKNKTARKIPTEKGKSSLTPTFPDRPIGYGNPPVETQIKPGEVRNAGGRPKILSGAYKAMLAEVNPRDPEGRTNAELIAVAARTEALKGDVSAMREIRSATEGDKSQVHTRTWEDDVVDLLVEGKLTHEQLRTELPADAERLIARAILRGDEGGAVAAGGDE